MLSTLVFSTTDRCPIECRHCGAECSPRNRQRLSLADMQGFIDEVGAVGLLELVVFTGGEPFLLGKDLLAAVAYCSARGLKTRIVSNAFWARSEAKARAVVRRCVDAGLTEINISCDAYHQAFIPIRQVRFANDACREAGLPALLGHRHILGDALTLEGVEEAMGRPLTRFDPDTVNPPNDVILTGYDVPICPDMAAVPDAEILYPDDDGWMQPCDAVLREIVVTPDRRLSICCGFMPRRVEEIYFGPVGTRSLLELAIEADADLLTNWLALEGPYGLMRFIRQHAPQVPFRPRYVSQCHLCAEILTRPDCRAVLEAHIHEKAGEIALKRTVRDGLSATNAVPA